MRNDLLGNVYVWFRTISWWDAQSRVISDVSVSDMDNTPPTIHILLATMEFTFYN